MIRRLLWIIVVMMMITVRIVEAIVVVEVEVEATVVPNEFNVERANAILQSIQSSTKKQL